MLGTGPSPGPRGRSRRGWIAAGSIAVAVSPLWITVGCGSDDAPSDADAAPLVVATTGVWADVTANLACDGLAGVEALMPEGADPHAFEASLEDRGRLEDAALVVTNGLGLEEGLEDTLEAVERAGTPVVEAAAGVDPLPYATAEDGDHGEDDHGEEDPHVWFDPVRVDAAIDDIARELVDAAGLPAAEVAACVDDYRRQLRELDAEVESLVETVDPQRRVLVTNHDSLGYFADRYGFEILGTVLPSPSGLAGTNPAQLQRLADEVERAGVPVIFAESHHSTRDAEALAARLDGVEVVVLDTAGLGDPADGADTYLGLVRSTAERVTDALG